MGARCIADSALSFLFLSLRVLSGAGCIADFLGILIAAQLLIVHYGSNASALGFSVLV